EETVVAENCLIPLPAGIPLTEAALLGCAVLTGYPVGHRSFRGGLSRRGRRHSFFRTAPFGAAISRKATYRTGQRSSG
ncbi:hypothetical protein ABT071_36965, partial [Streptomyces sp. NPDC002506]